jgi:hypothetical protein
MNEQDLRDCFAMFAMMGLVINENRSAVPEMAYQLADAMLEARKAKDKSGIVAVKRSPTTRRSK